MTRLIPRRVTAAAAAFVAVSLILAVCLGGLGMPSRREGTAPASWKDATYELAPGWSLRGGCRLPESLNSLTLGTTKGAPEGDWVYAGTSPNGGVYRFHVLAPERFTTIAEGLGDRAEFGHCCVNRLALRDLDGDGTVELLASTSQVFPRGRPRLYAWTLDPVFPVLRAMARPKIRSHWSHGLGFLPREDGPGERAFITFCGYGEVVEYQFRRDDPDGFRVVGLGWKQVGQLPASGEWLQTADIDNDGRADVCLGTGYAEGQAAIMASASPSDGSNLALAHEIREDGRFANVRFVVGDLRGDGTNDVVAWWITDHVYGGSCEMIRYRVGPEGVRERTVILRGETKDYSPEDGQMMVLDLDGDSRTEVIFATKSGSVWKYDPSPAATASPISRLLRIDGPLGPIAGGPVQGSKLPALFLGRGPEVIILRKDEAPQADSPRPTPHAPVLAPGDSRPADEPGITTNAPR